MQHVPNVDVLIIGAGISGIGMASHLVREKTGKSFAILEQRRAVGGTWDLFRYPGIRSDSDMYTFGYGFRPWHGTKILSDGPGIKQYLEDTAADFGVTPHISFGTTVTKASFDSVTNRWTVHSRDEGGESHVWSSQFLALCTGFYDYDSGFRPTFPGEEDFHGQIVHPQFWPEDLGYQDKKVVVIGSGATAVTLVPNLATTARHVTMLQRSPTFILALPSEDPLTIAMRRIRAPYSAIARASRARWIALQRGFYELCRRRPGLARTLILKQARLHLGPDVDLKHFNPSYAPWDQRLCVVPDADLFKVIRNGRASVVTDTIETFTENGIRLTSGQELEADIVVSATGFNVKWFGGIEVEVDGERVNPAQRLIYKGAMLEGIPNSALVVGYTNQSWTLKADLVAHYFCRLIKHMSKHGHQRYVAHANDADRTGQSIMADGLQSGYIRRANAVLPRQGARGPWKTSSDYFLDIRALRHGPISDGVLTFDRSQNWVEDLQQYCRTW